MSTGTTCTLYVDGARFADGAPGDPGSAPTALSGLGVAWGRDTTVDQPAPSTCTFTVKDEPGGAGVRSFLGRFHTGIEVDVTATGIQYPDPDTSTFADPGFETDPVAAAATNATVGATTRRVHGGARALQVLPVDPARRWTVTLPPAPFVPAGANPGAWDDIPQTAPGQTWDTGAWLYVPVGVVLTVSPVLFTGPWANSGHAAGTGTTLRGTGQWVQASGPFLPDTAGAWVGLGISAWPTGPAWAEFDPGLTWSLLDPAQTWQDVAAVYVDDVAVLSPAAGTPHEVLVFSGRITNLDAAWDEVTGGPLLKVTAADFTADLANRDVGDEPWPVEPMGDRFDRILELAGMPVTADIDPSVYGIPVSWRDVDKQATTGLLQDLATSVDAVMWAAVHQTTGAYLKVEDPSGRASLYHLEMIDGIVVVVGGIGGTVLSACDVLRDPIQFVQDVSDVTTRAAVTWLEQTLDDQGQPGTTEHTVTVIDADLEALYGTRRVSVTTELQASADALDVANRLMARLTESGWRASGFTVDDDRLDQAQQLLTLLDGTSRIGLPVRVTELPAWSPAGAELPVYLEGGRYSYDDGRWVLDLNVSSARGQGQSVTWTELDPTWRWADVDPELTWSGVYGVAGPQLAEAKPA